MPNYWYDLVRVTVRYVLEGYEIEQCDLLRAEVYEHIDDLSNQFGLEPIEADVYRDASGGLIVITQTEVSSDA